MIAQNARLRIAEIAIECIQVKEYQARYPERVLDYVELLIKHPNDYAGLLHVVPSDTHTGMYALLDGHHRFTAYILAGRKKALCVIEE